MEIMKKEIKAVFKLTGEEINIAMYNFYVQKLRENNINAVFSEKDIIIEFNDYLEVSLSIKEEKEI